MKLLFTRSLVSSDKFRLELPKGGVMDAQSDNYGFVGVDIPDEQINAHVKLVPIPEAQNLDDYVISDSDVKTGGERSKTRRQRGGQGVDFWNYIMALCVNPLHHMYESGKTLANKGGIVSMKFLNSEHQQFVEWIVTPDRTIIMRGDEDDASTTLRSIRWFKNMPDLEDIGIVQYMATPFDPTEEVHPITKILLTTVAMGEHHASECVDALKLSAQQLADVLYALTANKGSPIVVSAKHIDYQP